MAHRQPPQLAGHHLTGDDALFRQLPAQFRRFKILAQAIRRQSLRPPGYQRQLMAQGRGGQDWGRSW
jgi:hypothetical protein